MTRTPESKSQVLSMRLKSQQVSRLNTLARRLGRTASETAALLIEEALRRSEFGHIEFRSSPAGRQAYVMGSSLAVWEVVMIAKDYAMDAKKTAAHLNWPEYRVVAALHYAAAFSDEINFAISENDSYDFNRLSRSLPQIELFVAEKTSKYSAATHSSVTAGKSDNVRKRRKSKK